jgi:hypothetical protein
MNPAACSMCPWLWQQQLHSMQKRNIQPRHDYWWVPSLPYEHSILLSRPRDGFVWFWLPEPYSVSECNKCCWLCGTVWSACGVSCCSLDSHWRGNSAGTISSKQPGCLCRSLHSQGWLSVLGVWLCQLFITLPDPGQRPCRSCCRQQVRCSFSCFSQGNLLWGCCCASETYS